MNPDYKPCGCPTLPPFAKRRGAEGMTHHNMQLLLESLMYHLNMETRGKVMREVPGAYNEYHGREIVKVMSVSDREKEKHKRAAAIERKKKDKMRQDPLRKYN